MNTINISSRSLRTLLAEIPASGRILLAYSGGLDSTVLLHILCSNRQALQREFMAIHINHQLSIHAIDWARHCQSVCREYSVPCEIILLDAKKAAGASPEAYARELRYAALRKYINNDDSLLTAHHLDDQAETLLLQLLRGSGSDGLAAMPVIKPFGTGWLLRPLLDFSRQQLHEYAQAHELKWIEDESNTNINFDRNFIRHEVLPLIRQHWPSADVVLSRAAGHQAEVSRILREIADQDMASHGLVLDNKLNIIRLHQFTAVRMKNILRHWIRINAGPVPASIVLDKIIHEVIHARQDATPCVRWSGWEIRRYRDTLYIMPAAGETETDAAMRWDLKQPLHLATGILEARQKTGQGIKCSVVPDGSLIVRFRNGGETIRPAGRKETHTLKNLFQEADIPPWERNRVPLLYINDKLAAVAGYWTDAKFQAGVDEQGWEITWRAEKQQINDNI